MDRRAFLKFVTTAVAAGFAPALPFPVGATTPDGVPFDPTHAHGIVIDYTDKSLFDLCVEYCHESARQHLPKNYFYEIREREPLDYGRKRSVAWYYFPHIKRETEFLSKPTINAYGGFIYHGRFRT